MIRRRSGALASLPLPAFLTDPFSFLSVPFSTCPAGSYVWQLDDSPSGCQNCTGEGVTACENLTGRAQSWCVGFRSLPLPLESTSLQIKAACSPSGRLTFASQRPQHHGLQALRRGGIVRQNLPNVTNDHRLHLKSGAGRPVRSSPPFLFLLSSPSSASLTRYGR